MREVCSLIWLTLVGAFRSRVSLEAENTILRHQLNVLRRKSTKRPTFGVLDRLIFAGLYRLAPKVLGALAIVKPEKARKLECHSAYTPEWAELGMQLPVGRLYARGKSFIPAIPKALYEKLQANLTHCKEEHDRSQVERTAAAAAAQEAKSGTAKPSDAGAASLASGLPRTWEEIAPGHLVLAQESLPEGWWEAVVITRDKDILTLRYRDYPKAPKFTRHVATIAMVNPGAT